MQTRRLGVMSLRLTPYFTAHCLRDPKPVPPPSPTPLNRVMIYPSGPPRGLCDIIAEEVSYKLENSVQKLAIIIYPLSSVSLIFLKVHFHPVTSHPSWRMCNGFFSFMEDNNPKDKCPYQHSRLPSLSHLILTFMLDQYPGMLCPTEGKRHVDRAFCLFNSKV